MSADLLPRHYLYRWAIIPGSLECPELEFDVHYLCIMHWAVRVIMQSAWLAAQNQNEFLHPDLNPGN